jgi:hypothetical protein
MILLIWDIVSIELLTFQIITYSIINFNILTEDAEAIRNRILDQSFFISIIASCEEGPEIAVPLRNPWRTLIRH